MLNTLLVFARSAFSLRRDKTKPDDFCPPFRIIIDFCEEDLRVGTAQMPGGKTSMKFGRSKEENRLSLNKTYLNVFEVLIWVTKKWLFSEKVTNFDYCMPGDVLANLWRVMTCENVHWFRCRLHWIRRLRARAMHGHLVTTSKPIIWRQTNVLFWIFFFKQCFDFVWCIHVCVKFIML